MLNFVNILVINTYNNSSRQNNFYLSIHGLIRFSCSSHYISFLSYIFLVPLFKRFGLGSALGYLIAGILIGPYALKLIPDHEQVLHFAEFGVVLMFFLVGLELESQKKVWELRKILFGLGGLQLISTITLVTLAAHITNVTWPIAIVIGIGVAMSSTAIGLTSLVEKNCLIHLAGKLHLPLFFFKTFL